MPSVSVVFNAETGQYVASVQGMEKANAKAAESVAAAKNRILEATKEKVAAAKAEGASTEQLVKIQTRGALEMANVTEANSKRIVAALDRISERNKQVAAELQNMGQVKGAGGHGVTDRMAASSLVRGLENGNVGIRTVENFITTLPGASAALQGFFAVAGPLAFAAAVGEGVAKVVELHDKAVQLPKVIREGWESANEPLILSVDNMRKVNDELDIAHAKFTHQPENLLALAIDEDRIKADNLAASAHKAAEEIQKMLSANKSGFADWMLAGNVGTGRQSDEINGWFSEIAKKQAADRDAKRSGKDTPEAAQRRKEDLAAFIKEKYIAAGNNADGLKLANQNGSLDSVINNYTGARGYLGNLMDEQSEQDRNTTAEGQQKRDQEAKNLAEGAKTASEGRLKAMEAELAQLKLTRNVTLKDEYEFWDARRNTFAAGSAQYNSIVEKQATVAVEGARKATENIKKFQTEQVRAAVEGANELAQVNKDAAEIAARLQHDARERDKAQDLRTDAANELQALKSRNAAALEEQTILAQVGKTITANAAATQIAAAHAKAYADEMDRLNAKAAQVARASYLTEAEKQQQLGKLGIDAENLNSRHAQELLRDRQAQASPETSAAIGARDALDELADAAKDSAGQMRQFIGSSLQEVNRAITQGNWKGAGQGIASNLEGTLLNKAEGSVLQALGFGKKGKPTGGAGDPMHVVVDGGLQIPGTSNSLQLPGSMGQSLSDLGKKLFGGGGGDDGGGVSDIFGSLFSGLLPGFATGGYVGAGTMAMVGENGPEPVFFGDQARVMSNSDMRAAIGGSGGGPSIHVDARGSTDPAQTMAMVRAGVAQMMPQIARASADHYKTDNRRNGPSNRR